MESTQDNVKTGPGLTTALLAFGVFMALLFGTYKAMGDRREDPTHAGVAGKASRIEQIAVMSESIETSRATDFRRADVAAVMGHGILDLREADIQGREAVIETFVLMGHVTIRVPENWTVVIDDLAIMGATNNRTRREGADPGKRVRIEGITLMGALTISH